MCGFHFEIRMTERINDKVAHVPGRYSEEIQAIQAIHNAQDRKNTQVEYKLFGERERKRGEWARQVTLVMLDVDPMKSRDVKHAMGDVMPRFRPKSGQQEWDHEGSPRVIGEKLQQYEYIKNNGVNWSANRIPYFSVDLLLRYRDRVYSVLAELEMEARGKKPKQCHEMAQYGNQDKRRDFRGGDHCASTFDYRDRRPF
jgi:hypothetical protein